MKLVLWDFDGTLAQRDGGWTGTLLEILRGSRPDLSVPPDTLRPYLQSGFPWHTPNITHPEIRSPDDWWRALTPVFERALASVGVGGMQAKELASRVRATYCDPSQWRVYTDVVPTLESLSGLGWSHRILSNHVPELPNLVRQLNLSKWFEGIHNSAETGVEKPHPNAFTDVLRILPRDAAVWMVGDSLNTDVQGAEQVGIPAILVRTPRPAARRYCGRLTEVVGILEAARSDTRGLAS